MKADVTHRVPLSGQAFTIVEAMATVQEGPLVFPGVKAGKPLSRLAMMRVLHGLGYSHVTVHGFRSTFRDWAAEKTHYPREVAEAALAHTNKNKVEASYLRSDFLEQRRQLMEAWADFAYRLPSENVIPVRFGGAT
jgi:integrase